MSATELLGSACLGRIDYRADDLTTSTQPRGRLNRGNRNALNRSSPTDMHQTTGRRVLVLPRRRCRRPPLAPISPNRRRPPALRDAAPAARGAVRRFNGHLHTQEFKEVPGECIFEQKRSRNLKRRSTTRPRSPRRSRVVENAPDRSIAMSSEVGQVRRTGGREGTAGAACALHTCSSRFPDAVCSTKR